MIPKDLIKKIQAETIRIGEILSNMQAMNKYERGYWSGQFAALVEIRNAMQEFDELPSCPHVSFTECEEINATPMFFGLPDRKTPLLISPDNVVFLPRDGVRIGKAE